MRDNLAALQVLQDLRRTNAAPSDEDRKALSAWHGWGAAPQLFDRPEFEGERTRLRNLLGEIGYAAAARTTLNAHYTDDRLVDALWAGLHAFGIEEGVVLEPGCGRGSFLAVAPDSFAGVGIELDPATADIARLLVDDRHRVLARDFAKVRLHAGSVDAVIGNVPFGRYQLYDPEFNPGVRLSIHDHFIVKSLAALAPSGVAVLLTSRYSLDRLDAIARRQMGELADFLGAVRLPEHSHEAAAGTTVVTDVVVFRRRADGTPAHHAAGFLERPEQRSLEHGGLSVSRYFSEHPERVLGEVTITSGPFGPELAVRSDAPVGTGLADALAALAAEREVPPYVGRSLDVEAVVRSEDVEVAPVGRIERTVFGFRQYGPGGWEHHDVGAQGAELERLCRLRDLATSLVALEADNSSPDSVVEARRSELAGEYRRYVQRHGPINRVRVNEVSGRRSYPRLAGFRSDPDWPRVAALELYDDSSGKARPAALLERRVVVPAAPVTHTDSPDDALRLSMAERGRVDLTFIADLLDIDEDDCLATLGERVFVDPAGAQVVTRAEYCSGNVRRKLAEAMAVAAHDPRIARNVEALSAVVPRDVTADELAGTLGAPWIPVSVVTEFARSLAPSSGLGNQISVARIDSANEWKVAAPRWVGEQMSADHPFGTSRATALHILECGLNGRAPIVTDETPDKRRIVNPEATAAACEKADELREEFDRWLLREDDERAAAMLSIYNERFNAYVARHYDGVAIAAPGLSSDFVLRPHQTQAIARVIFGGNTALWHPVGAGKTAEMVVSGMEQRRLGLTRRPAYVVPNHLLEDFAHEFLRLYPAAQVLTVASDDISPAKRHLFAARVRSHDWDAVIITHSSFTRWAVSPETEHRVLAARVAELRAERVELAAANDSASRTLTKNLERSIARYEAKLDALSAQIASHQDEHGFPFDQSGIDYVYVDEAQEYKNGELRSTARNLRGVPVGDGSQRAMDLDTKLRFLRAAHPERQVTMATGTPVSNTVAELYIAMRYLRPDLLDEYGVSAFDAFRAVFCDTTSDMELDVGRSFRRVERLSRYKNLPELARLWGEFADLVRVEDLGLPRPELRTGRRQVIGIEPPEALERFITETVRERIEQIRSRLVEPHEDNMLKLSSDARLASFDWQTYSGEEIDDEHSTVGVAARNIAELYHEHKNDVFQSAIGENHPRRGAFQLVFCDLGTPKADDATTAYERLRDKLIAFGVPKGEIRFIHEHDQNDEEKARFFAACRDGRVTIAIGSTPKLGTGVNVQYRQIALHHLDAPWRPSDVEQRDGRIVRQGNQNPVVDIFVYPTLRSFATYSWQTLERKAGFVGQLMRAEPDGPRSLEVTDEEALSYGEVKAISTGDPAFIELAHLEDAVARLERLQRSHSREQVSLSRRIERLEYRLAHATRLADALEPVAPSVAAVLANEHPWQLRIGEHTYDNRGDAARALAPLLSSVPRPIAAFPTHGIDVEWRITGYGERELGVVGLAEIAVKVDDRSHDGLIGALTRLTHAVETIPERLAKERTERADLDAQVARARDRVGEPFAHLGELADTRRELSALAAELQRRYREDVSTGSLASDVNALDPTVEAETAQSNIDELRRQLDTVSSQARPAPGGEEDAAFRALYPAGDVIAPDIAPELGRIRLQ